MRNINRVIGDHAHSDAKIPHRSFQRELVRLLPAYFFIFGFGLLLEVHFSGHVSVSTDFCDMLDFGVLDGNICLVSHRI